MDIETRIKDAFDALDADLEAEDKLAAEKDKKPPKEIKDDEAEEVADEDISDDGESEPEDGEDLDNMDGSVSITKKKSNKRKKLESEDDEAEEEKGKEEDQDQENSDDVEAQKSGNDDNDEEEEFSHARIDNVYNAIQDKRTFMEIKSGKKALGDLSNYKKTKKQSSMQADELALIELEAQEADSEDDDEGEADSEDADFVAPDVDDDEDIRKIEQKRDAKKIQREREKRLKKLKQTPSSPVVSDADDADNNNDKPTNKNKKQKVAVDGNEWADSMKKRIQQLTEQLNSQKQDPDGEEEEEDSDAKKSKAKLSKQLQDVSAALLKTQRNNTLVRSTSVPSSPSSRFKEVIYNESSSSASDNGVNGNKKPLSQAGSLLKTTNINKAKSTAKPSPKKSATTSKKKPTTTKKPAVEETEEEEEEDDSKEGKETTTTNACLVGEVFTAAKAGNNLSNVRYRIIYKGLEVKYSSKDELLETKLTFHHYSTCIAVEKQDIVVPPQNKYAVFLVAPNHRPHFVNIQLASTIEKNSEKAETKIEALREHRYKLALKYNNIRECKDDKGRASVQCILPPCYFESQKNIRKGKTANNLFSKKCKPVMDELTTCFFKQDKDMILDQLGKQDDFWKDIVKKGEAAAKLDSSVPTPLSNEMIEVLDEELEQYFQARLAAQQADYKDAKEEEDALKTCTSEYVFKQMYRIMAFYIFLNPQKRKEIPLSSSSPLSQDNKENIPPAGDGEGGTGSNKKKKPPTTANGSNKSKKSNDKELIQTQVTFNKSYTPAAALPISSSQ